MTGMDDRIATERICRTADGIYVPDGHPNAAFLVVGVGGPLPADFTGFGQAADIAVEATPAEVIEALAAGAGDESDEQADEQSADEPAKPAPKVPKKAK